MCLDFIFILVILIQTAVKANAIVGFRGQFFLLFVVCWFQHFEILVDRRTDVKISFEFQNTEFRIWNLEFRGSHGISNSLKFL